MKNYKIAEMFLLNNTAQRNQSRVSLSYPKVSLIRHTEGREEGVKRKMKNIRGKEKMARE